MKKFAGNKKAALCFLAITLAFLPAAGAWAYSPPAEQLLTFMIKELGRARGLRVSETIRYFDPSREEELTADKAAGESVPAAAESRALTLVSSPASMEFTATSLYRFPDRFREEIGAGEGASLFVAAPHGAARVSAGELVAETEDRFDFFKDLLLFRNPGRLMERLGLAGVETGLVSLGRFNGEIAYVIGAQYPDETVPQVWLSKKTFLPLRWIVTRQVAGTNREGVEIRYSDWTPVLRPPKNTQAGVFPGKISFFQDGALVAERVAGVVALNPDFPPDAFDVNEIKRSAAPSQELLEERAAPVDMEEVKRTIREFREMYE